MENTKMETTENKQTEQKNAKKVPRTTGAFLLWTFIKIKESRRWWLFPFWVLLAVLALILFLSGNGALLPAIYMVM